ncbi:MAG TPA: D-alanyl-D-alanine carboxypeptidase family protein [Yinghuangia sp.]|uniref:D-alanyl-D-alanine carboxypeptidase family protein n=1 Tax=Yinghuangia sp. YIM S10712 TaxID=3436930 RepID=UPI002CA9C10D|nr:D-alanyl-D-alanine carboxypeptidase family protein [Yinghuangia sp.]
MNQFPQDQGGSGRRAGSGPVNGPGHEYSEAAQYLDSAWQASSDTPAPDPSMGPTQVVPIQEMPPSQPIPAAPAAPAGAGAPPAEPRHAEHDLGAYAMSADAGPGTGGAVPGAGDGTGQAGSGAVPGGGQGGDGPDGGHGGGQGGGQRPHGPGDGDEGRGPSQGRRRRNLIIWSVVGVVALGGAGLVAANTLGGDDNSSSTTTAVGSPTPGPTLPSPSAAPTTVPPAVTSAPPAASPTGSASPTRTSSASPSPTKSTTASGSASPSATSSSTRVDKDNDGITDDPAATDPNALAPAARTAYMQAKNAMAAEGITMTLTSGKRSYEHQKELWEQEVRDTGSEEAARMRVLPPDESTHVHGTAIDINVAAQPWMKAKGSRYGWCQIYANESWHFEYSASYKTQGCPSLKPHP